MRVYVCHDPREQAAWDVAAKTARGFGCDVHPVYEDRLRASGILTRPVDRRGEMYDFASGANQSTEFAISRFSVPLLAHSGLCLGVDCDVVFLRDPRELLMRALDKAVYVVKHPEFAIEQLTKQRNIYDFPATKMDGRLQTAYHRKLWSSVILWNCDHPANRRLNLAMLNQLPGRDLHAFSWLSGDEVGELPIEANWLVGIQPKPADPIIAHFTLGGPWIDGWKRREHDEIWTEASKR